MKENKKQYQKMALEVIKFSGEDVIVTSNFPAAKESYEADVMKENPNS